MTTLDRTPGLRWWLTELLVPDPPQVAGILESAALGHGFQRQLRIVHQSPREFQTDLGSKFRDRKSSRGAKRASQIARTHPGYVCQPRHGCLGFGMSGDVVLHIMHTGIQVGTVVEEDTFLLLMAIATQVHHHLTRDLRGHHWTVMLLD